MNLREIVERIARTESLDPLADRARSVVKRLLPAGAAKDALSGTWLDHPLHPPLTDIPIGSFTSATVLDLIGGDRSRGAADKLVVLGVLSAIPTALAGAADWSDTHGHDQRIGVVHAAANAVGIALYAASLPPRRRGSHTAASLLGLAGMTAMTVGGYLGGSLTYSRGVGVNNTAFEEVPREWTPVLAGAELDDRQPRCADAAGVPVLLYRTDGRVHVIANHCSHAGGPLHEGTVDEVRGTVTCPWHSSVFALADGSALHGPASAPQPAFDVRERDGTIEVRAR